jgi:hypothetical protein
MNRRLTLSLALVLSIAWGGWAAPASAAPVATHTLKPYGDLHTLADERWRLRLTDAQQTVPAAPGGYQRYPLLAAGLTLTTPLLLLAVEQKVRLGQYIPITNASIGIVVAGFGAGHVYAGEPWQGALVAVGGPLLLLGAYRLMQWQDARNEPPGLPGELRVGNSHTGEVTALALIYGGLAAWHAYWTAEEKNQAAQAANDPTPE